MQGKSKYERLGGYEVNDALKIIYNLLIAIFPILGIYNSFIPSVNLGEILIIAAAPLLAYGAMNKRVAWSPYWLFLIWAVISTCFAALTEIKIDYFNVVFMALRLIFHAVIFLWFSSVYFDKKLFTKIYGTLVYISVLFIFAQWIVFNLTGYLLPYLIPFLKLRWTITTPSEIYAFRLTESSLRLSSFFVEPADYAQYVMPFYIFLLFKEGKKSFFEWVIIILIILSVAISTSALFLFSVFIITALWCVWKIVKLRKVVTPVFMIMILVTAVILFVLLYPGNESIDALVERFSEIDPEKGATSGNMRVLRGFAVFNEIDNINKIFGVGIGNTYGYMIAHDIRTQYDYGTTENHLNFMSSISNVLVWNGAVGLIIYLMVMFRQFLRSNRTAKVLMVYLAILMFAASIYVVPTYPFIMTIIIGNEMKISEEYIVEQY